MPLALTPSEWWIIATASACAAACALCGCYLVLRRMSMLGDAITHAILPGLAGAFLLTGTRSVPVMLAGALLVGLLTAALSAFLTRKARIPGDAAMGVVFTSLFALGVVMISRAAHQVDLDPGCVLYGLLEFVAFDRVSVLGVELPRALASLLVVLALVTIAVVLLRKELTLVCFDSALATSLGFSAAWLHYGAIGAVAATSVVSFEAVGSILVVAMLVGPPAAARLLTDSLPRMAVLSVVLGVVCACVGAWGAIRWNVSVAGGVATATGLVFVLVLVLSPRHGVLAHRVRRLALALRIEREDALGVLVRRLEAPTGESVPREDLRRGGLLPRVALIQLRWLGMVTGDAATPRLTPEGEREATRLLRAHRLWETYLARDTSLPVDHLHAPAERVEHFLSPPLARRLGEEVGDRPLDPQGKPIPPPTPPPSPPNTPAP